MKKVLCALIAGTLSFSSAFCVNASTPQSSNASFTIEPIRHDLKSSEPIVFSVTVPNTYEDGILFASFYTDGVLTKTIPLDVSSQTSFTKLGFQATYEDGDGYPLTPDRIRIYTWNKNNLKPITLSDDVLTEDVITQANSTTVKNILNHLLGENNKPYIIDIMRKNVLGNPYTPDTQVSPDVRFAKVIELLDAMETCARIAYNNKSTMLLTSESTKRLLSEEFDSLQTLIETVKNNKDLKNELVRVRDALTNNQKEVINRLSHFFDIDLASFV